MPFTNRAVTPVYLSRQRISHGQKVENECEAVSNNTLVGTIRQMACLVQFADNIFTRIQGECKVIYDRSVVVRNKLTNVVEIVEKLDARTMEIPEGDIESFIKIKRHYQTHYEAEQSSLNFFLVENRPRFISDVYDQADEKPLQIIRSIEDYRKDEVADCEFPSNLHHGKNTSRRQPGLEIETRRPATLLRERNDENEDVVSSTDTLIASSKILPSPEELTKATAEEFPATMVPIDVTGAGFQRMSNFRKSLLQITFLGKRKKKRKSKRRNTICEGENSTLKKDVQDALTQTDNIPSKSVKRRSLGLFNSRRKSADMLDSSDSVFLNGTLRSKKASMSASCQTDDVLCDNEPRGISSEVKLSGSNDKENLSGSNRFLRGLFRATKLKVPKSSNSAVNKDSSSSNKNSKKGNSVIPISTLSQAMNVAVKMRDSSVRTGKNPPKDEDRNSSSGNWSASSSTRTSFDSDCVHKTMVNLPLRGMTSSQSSTVSEKDNHDGDACSQEETVTGASGYTSDSTMNGTMSTCSFAYQPNDHKSSKTKTDMWLYRQAKPNLNSSVDEHTSDGDCSTPLVLSPFTTRRCKNISNATDDESSVYSVDTDGYYTSMHTDSGLRGGPLPSPPPLPPLASCSERDSSETCDTLNQSEIEFSKSDTMCIRQKPTPPCPPARTCSKLNYSPEKSCVAKAVDVAEDKPQGCDDFTPNSDGNCRSNSISSTCSSNTTDSSASTSESDPEAIKRLKNKTTINSKGYPSMVHVSESEDDSDIKASLSSSNYWQKAGYVSKDPIYAKPSALITPTSMGSFTSPRSPVSSPINTIGLATKTDKSPEPVDIKLITYPVAQTKKVNTNSSPNTVIGRHSLRRPTTLNIKSVNISEHDVPMLQKQYSLTVSTVPTLYCDSLLKQKSGLQRSQSMKQEEKSPLSPKSQLIQSKMTVNPESPYGSNSLGRKRNKHHLMNVDSVVAAQLPLSKKYSTLPTKLKYHSSLNGDDKLPNAFSGKQYNSLSLDRRRASPGPKRIHSPVPEFSSRNVVSPQNSPTFKFHRQIKPGRVQSSISPARENSPKFKEPAKIPPISRSQTVTSPITVNVDKGVGISSPDNSSQEPSPQSQTEQSKPKKPSMSSQDLYIAIHNSKKKLNIKTDPFASPMSSRSNSPNVGRLSNSSSRASTPGCISPTPSMQPNISNGSIPRKTGTVAETGFLNPRSTSLRNSPGERRSWAAGSRNSPSPRNVQAEKPSLAYDRLRTRKPTSISDFKKLLLQTKTSSGQQRSAAELLKATSPIPGKTSSPTSDTHFQPISPVPVSPPMKGNQQIGSKSGNMRSHNGHIMSPFKRGNRLRSSLPVNGLITSPIWEDNGEGENPNSLPSRSSKCSNIHSPANRTYGYLTQDSCQTSISPPAHLTNNRAILHIPTRSALESSV